MISYDNNYLAVLTDQRGETQEDGGKSGGKEGAKGGNTKDPKKKKQSPVASGSTLTESKENSGKEKQKTKVSSGSKKKKQEKPYRLLIFRKTGEKILDKPIDFMGNNMELSQDKVILYQEKYFKVYDFQGRLRYNGETEEGLQYIRSLSKIQFGGTDLFLACRNREEAIRIK